MLHVTSFFVAVNVGVWIVAGLALAALIVAFARNRSWRFVPARAVVATAVVLAVGVVGAALTLLPSIIANSPLAIQPTGNNDAFYYASVAQWMQIHSLSTAPDIGLSPASGTDSPAYGPAVESLRLGLRVGQELLQAGVSTILGTAPVATFSPMLGLYVLLLPGGAWVLGSAFRLSGPARVLLGAILVTSYSLNNQTLNQNADSILGIALLPLVLGLCALVLFRRPDQQRRAPVWLAGLALAALVGTYTEYVPFLFAALGGMALIGPIATLKVRVLRALGILGVSVALGPVIWFRALQGLALAATLSGRADAAVPSMSGIAWFFAGPYTELLRHFEPTLGARPVKAILLAVFLLAAIGIVCALVSQRTRGLAVGAALIAPAGAAYIATRGNPYITGRAIDMVTPLLLIVVVLGWSHGARWAARIPRTSVAVALKRVIVVGGIAAVGAGGAVIAVTATVRSSDDRIVSRDLVQAAEWIDVLDDDGGNTAVAVGTLFEQLWLSDSLAARPDVSYINLRGDLGYRSNLNMVSFWDDSVDHYVLVGPGAYASYEPDAVVTRNSTFTLLDLSKDATIAVPKPVSGEANWSWVVDSRGSITGFGNAQVQLLTSRDDLAGASLAVVGPAGSSFELVADGATSSVTPAAARQTRLPLDGVAVADGLATVSVRSSADPTNFELVGVRAP